MASCGAKSLVQQGLRFISMMVEKEGRTHGIYIYIGICVKEFIYAHTHIGQMR